MLRSVSFVNDPDWVTTLWVPHEDALCVANCRQIRALHMCQSPECTEGVVGGFFVQWLFVTGSTAVWLCICCSFTCWFTVHCAEDAPLSPSWDACGSCGNLPFDLCQRSLRLCWQRPFEVPSLLDVSACSKQTVGLTPHKLSALLPRGRGLTVVTVDWVFSTVEVRTHDLSEAFHMHSIRCGMNSQCTGPCDPASHVTKGCFEQSDSGAWMWVLQKTWSMADLALPSFQQRCEQVQHLQNWCPTGNTLRPANGHCFQFVSETWLWKQFWEFVPNQSLFSVQHGLFPFVKENWQIDITLLKNCLEQICDSIMNWVCGFVCWEFICFISQRFVLSLWHVKKIASHPTVSFRLARSNLFAQQTWNLKHCLHA